MIQDIYNDNIIIYAYAALCGLGILVRFILDMVYIYLVKESDKLGNTNNKFLKYMKLKFETCYKLNIGVNNVDTFVDKNLTKYRFCGFLLSTWENFSGQVLLLSFLIIPISAIFGVVFEISNEQILYTGAVGVLTGAALILVDKMTNLPVKKHMIRLNLLDYLENFCKVRLEHEVYQPEKLEQYRKEYQQVIDSNVKKVNKTDPENKEELSRRIEARKRKEEVKRLQALKREEEQEKIEKARKEEERRKLEERKQLAAKRREEELVKLQEEREALMLRREELKKKAEEKQKHNEIKRREKEEKEKILSNIEQELRPSKKAEEKQILESIEEVAADIEESKIVAKKEQDEIRIPEMSPEEEKLVEDVLREFFA